jgi:hypothetical protein
MDSGSEPCIKFQENISYAYERYVRDGRLFRDEVNYFFRSSKLQQTAIIFPILNDRCNIIFETEYVCEYT